LAKPKKPKKLNKPCGAEQRGPLRTSPLCGEEAELCPAPRSGWLRQKRWALLCWRTTLHREVDGFAKATQMASPNRNTMGFAPWMQSRALRLRYRPLLRFAAERSNPLFHNGEEECSTASAASRHIMLLSLRAGT
jgi:hypothetical protein